MKIETISKGYEKEFDEYLIDSNVIKPWCLKEFNVNPIYLDCTIEDIKTYWNQEARFREGFLVNKEDKIVNIPNFFVKIDGVYDKKKDYNNLISNFKSDIIYKIKPLNSEDERRVSCHILDKKKDIIKNQIKKGKITIDFLKEEIEDNSLLYDLNSYVLDYIMDKLNQFILENKDNYRITKLIYSLLKLRENEYQALQNWDFGYNVPKIIIHNLSANDIDIKFLELIDFFNYLGFDILIFSKRGETLLENDTHFKNLTTLVLDKFEKPITDSEYRNKKETKETILTVGIVVFVIAILLIPCIIGINKLQNKTYNVYQVNDNYETKTTLTEKDLTLIEVKYKDYARNMITDLSTIENLVLNEDIEKGEIIRSSQFSTIEEIENKTNSLEEITITQTGSSILSKYLVSFKPIFTIMTFFGTILLMIGVFKLVIGVTSYNAEIRSSCISPILSGITITFLSLLMQVIL